VDLGAGAQARGRGGAASFDRRWGGRRGRRGHRSRRRGAGDVAVAPGTAGGGAVVVGGEQPPVLTAVALGAVAGRHGAGGRGAWGGEGWEGLVRGLPAGTRRRRG
jgi:hypothetical protein